MSILIALIAAVAVVALVVYWDRKSQKEIEQERQRLIQDIEKNRTIDYLLDPWEKEIS